VEFWIVRIGKERLPALRMAVAEAWELALLRIRSINLRRACALPFQWASSLISKSAAKLPSLKQVAHSNLSFGVIVIVLLVISTVMTIELLRPDQPTVDTFASGENINAQAAAQRTRRSNKNSKGKRTGREVPTRK